jgi:hypothetical protein
MEKFNLKQHNRKIIELSKKAAKGTYPTPKIAKIGTVIGAVIGIIMTIFGVIGIFIGSNFGKSSLYTGIIICISDFINWKRIKNVK